MKFFFKGHIVLFFCLTLNLCNSLSAQDYWSVIENSSIKITDKIFEEKSIFYRLDKVFFNSKLKNKLSQIKQVISLPNEKGKYEKFTITEAKLLSPELKKKYPNIKTYIGISNERLKVKARITLSSYGVNFWMKLPNGIDYFFQPINKNNNLHYGYKRSSLGKNQLNCKTTTYNIQSSKSSSSKNSVTLEENVLKTFRIAIATTGEYTSFWGDDDDSNGSNSEDAFVAVVSTLNRVNEIYESDLQISLELVSDSSIIFSDATTDPFYDSLNDEAQSTLDSLVGNSNYDLGHLFDYGVADGDAGCVGCICVEGLKGRGYSTHPFVDWDGSIFRNDYFDLDYVAHEIGHQFGAYHTYAFQNEGSESNVEPGSGSTIMGYAGITEEDDIQSHGDPYFHFVSIKSIRNYVSNSSCSVNKTISNNLIDAEAGDNYFIPKGTAYELSAITNYTIDSKISYSWEQLDRGQIDSSNFGPLNFTGPIARSVTPSLKPTRSIPNISQVLSGNLRQTNPTNGSAWETVSDVGRILNWGVTVRDLRNLQQGLTSQDSMKIDVISDAGPFVLTSQSSPNIIWGAGSKQTITWDVANTDLEPLNTKTVSVFLSTDGGYNYPIKLIESTLNDGIEDFVVPSNISSNFARIKIKGDNSIYYSINNENFEIQKRPFIVSFEPNKIDLCSENTTTVRFNLSRFMNFEETVLISMEDFPEFLNLNFSKENFEINDTEGSLSISGLNQLLPGIYDFNIKAKSGNFSFMFSFSINLRKDILLPPIINYPFPGQDKLDLSPILKWENNPNDEKYQIQLSKDYNFNNLIVDEIITNNSYQLIKLENDQSYYWRVKSINICGFGDYTDSAMFITDKTSCLNFNGTNLPIALKDAENLYVGITETELYVPYDLPIIDLNILVNIEHSWLEDLTVFIQSPDGIKVVLASKLGGSGDNYSETLFDQESNNSIIYGSPPFSGSFSPIQSLEVFNNKSAFGKWKLIIEDSTEEDSGAIIDLSIEMCLLGTPLPNSDEDSFVDNADNCPAIYNQDQLDIDGNGIGDVCDIFSNRNILISKQNSTCISKNNGKINITAKAQYTYKAYLESDNGYSKILTFDSSGLDIKNLSPGNYSICINSDSFPQYKFCFETAIIAPEKINIQSFLNIDDQVLNLKLYGSDNYIIRLNDEEYFVEKRDEYKIRLTKKINFIEVKTKIECQGVYKEIIMLDNLAEVFPNPVKNETTLVLPSNLCVELYLFNSSGLKIWSSNVLDSNLYSSIQIPMDDLNPGLYILEMKNDKLIQTFKLLKE